MDSLDCLHASASAVILGRSLNVPGNCLSPTFLVVPRCLACLVPRTWSALMRSRPHHEAVCPSPPCDLLLCCGALLADSSDKFPIPRFTPGSALVSCDSDEEVLALHRTIARLHLT
jgi:hypothetical protein